MVMFDRQKVTCKLRVRSELVLRMTFSGAMFMLVNKLRLGMHWKKPNPAVFCHKNRSWYIGFAESGDKSILVVR